MVVLGRLVLTTLYIRTSIRPACHWQSRPVPPLDAYRKLPYPAIVIVRDGETRLSAWQMIIVITSMIITTTPVGTLLPVSLDWTLKIINRFKITVWTQQCHIESDRPGGGFYKEVGTQWKKIILHDNNGWDSEAIQSKSFVWVGPWYPQVFSRQYTLVRCH